MWKLGIIGGSGLYAIDGLADARWVAVESPWGAPSDAVLTGRPRHEGRTVHEALLNAYESAPFDYGPEVPAELAALCNAATSRDRAARPAPSRAC